MENYHQEHIRTPEIEVELDQLRTAAREFTEYVKTTDVENRDGTLHFSMTGVAGQEDVLTAVTLKASDEDSFPYIRINESGASRWDSMWSATRECTFVGGDLKVKVWGTEPKYVESGQEGHHTSVLADSPTRINDPQDISYLKSLFQDAPELITKYQRAELEARDKSQVEVAQGGRLSKLAKTILKTSR